MNDTERILADLVAIPVLGGESNLPVLAYLRAYLDDWGVPYALVPNEDGTKASLHARIGPAVDGGLILSGHMDVVPVEGQDWRSDPFQLAQRDDRLHARGACDMKGFLACVLATVPAMTKAKLAKPLYLAFSYDEEVGCLAAPALVEAMLDRYEERPRYAVIGEPSMLRPIVGHKGICVFETKVYGSAGHSSRIRQEVSAVHEAARLVLWLENKMNELVAAGRVDPRFDPPHTSLHVGHLHGGIAPNVIADRCTFSWDVRCIPRDNLADIEAAFRAYCAEREAELRQRFAGARIETTYFHPPVPPLDTAEDQSVVPLIRELSAERELRTVAYASEAGQFAAAGLESVICGPGSIAQAHRANEYISRDQLAKGTRFIERVLDWARA